MSSVLRAWYIFLVLGFISFVLVAFVGQTPYAISSAVAFPSKLFYRTGSNLRNIVLSATDRRQLRNENANLKRELGALETQKRLLEINVERLQNLLDIQATQSSGAVMSAPVASISPGAIIKELTLGRGTLHGVRKDMPVTAPAGLVGLVTAVTPRTSTVRTLTDPQSRVGITVEERGGQGIAVGMPGGRIRVVNFITENPLSIGDRIETSSRGGLFPRGLHIGTIIEIPAPNLNSLRTEFVVQPAVEVATLLDVTLIEAQ